MAHKGIPVLLNCKTGIFFFITRPPGHGPLKFIDLFSPVLYLHNVRRATAC